jgi:hypothetical protein
VDPVNRKERTNVSKVLGPQKVSARFALAFHPPVRTGTFVILETRRWRVLFAIHSTKPELHR